MRSTGYTHQQTPFIVPREDGKHIEEHFGRAATGTADISAARMIAPAGWSEEPQEPEFDEYLLVVRGSVEVTIGHDSPARVVVDAGESLKVERGMRVRYANPFDAESEYWSLCIPAFAPELAHML